jgi:predicted transcriptional regulator
MGRSQRDVTEAELAILQVLWEEGTATVRRLIERLYPPGGASAHATVQKLLERLEAKGCIRRDRSGPVQVIIPAIGREVLVRRRLRDVADDLCGGSLVAMLSHLVNPGRLASRDRKALREFLQQLEDEAALRDDRDESRE